ncbi:MAG: inosose dehydratase, partial [Actinomyces sp.]
RQLDRERVLAEMAELGFTRTELGSIGWLPTDPDELRRVLERHGLSLLGGFVPLTLAAPRPSWEAEATAAADLLARAGGEFFVTALISDHDTWRRAPLDDAAWAPVAAALGELDELVASRGLCQVVHPHVDTLVETAAEIDRLLATTGVAVCFDTAHFGIGGVDLCRFVDEHLDRIGLVHLKDLDLGLADDLRHRRLSLMESVQAGIFPPLGRGDLPIDDIVTTIEGSGRRLWYVLEQDTALTDGEPPPGAGPRLDVRESIDHLRTLDRALARSGGGVRTTTQEG